MRHQVFHEGDFAYVQEPGNPLYLVIVRDNVFNARGANRRHVSALVPVTVYARKVEGWRDPHVVFTRHVHAALWTFTGLVEAPHDKRKC